MARRFPAPQPGPDSQPFFDAAAEGRFLLKRCGACGEAHYYPRPICPFCFSPDTRWEEASGRGTIYSLSVMRRGADAPYALAYVTLAEGPAVLTNIVTDQFDGLRIGQAVEIEWSNSDGGPRVPTFRPTDD